jgi:tetratricopeptide (TPR) repeat protein
MRSKIPGLVNKPQEDDPDQLLLSVRQYWKLGERERALILLRGSIQRNSAHIATWRLFAELAPGIKEKIRACESILRMNPADEEARTLLSTYRHFQDDPEEWANYLEEQGRVDEAISVYKNLAAMAPASVAFDRYYHEIIRLENDQLEQIKFVNPLLSIIRLSLGLPILYILLALMQSGFKPVVNTPAIIWTGFPVVVFGSFLTAMSSAGSSPLFWGNNIKIAGKERLKAARIVLSLSGWLLILFPYALMIVDALIRVQGFETPPLPLFK